MNSRKMSNKPKALKERPVVLKPCFIPSPYELAQTAIALCQLHSNGVPEPTKYFSNAKQPLTQAQEHLEIVPEQLANDIVASLFPDAKSLARVGQPIPFEELLKPLEIEHRAKKPRTYVGAITTKYGLKEAIRRYFPKQDASRIIQAQSMTENEWKQLLEAKSNAIQEQASKRSSQAKT